MQTNTFKNMQTNTFKKNAKEYCQRNTYWKNFKNIKAHHVHVPWCRHWHYAPVDDLHLGVALQTRPPQKGLNAAQWSVARLVGPRNRRGSRFLARGCQTDHWTVKHHHSMRLGPIHLAFVRLVLAAFPSVGPVSTWDKNFMRKSQKGTKLYI